MIADDHDAFRDGLRTALAREPSLELVPTRADVGRAASSTAELKPSVLILDISLPEAARGTIGAIIAANPATRVLVVGVHDEPAVVRAALEAGAAGYVLKRNAPRILLEAVAAVRAGKTFLDPHLPFDGTPRRAATGSPLSHREREVLMLLARGHTYREAGDRLHVGPRTIETHRRNIAEKLGLRTRADLLRYALDTGLLTADS